MPNADSLDPNHEAPGLRIENIRPTTNLTGSGDRRTATPHVVPRWSVRSPPGFGMSAIGATRQTRRAGTLDPVRLGPRAGARRDSRGGARRRNAARRPSRVAFFPSSTLDFSAAAESPPSSRCMRDGAGRMLTVHYMRTRDRDAAAVFGWVPTRPG